VVTTLQGPVDDVERDMRGGNAPTISLADTIGVDDELGVPLHARRPKWRTTLGIVLPPMAVAAVFVGGWYIVTYLVLDKGRRFLLPAPHQVFVEGVIRSGTRGEILEALWNTTKVASVGLLLATVLGMGLAIAMHQARWVERSFYPWAVVLQTVPILAIVPVIGFWWGFDFRSRAIVCVMISIFPIITNTLFGLQSVPQDLINVFRMQRVGRITRLRKLDLPAAMPAVFTGLRISAGLSVIGAIVGDLFFRQGDPGIGRLIDTYRAKLYSEALFASIGYSCLLGIAAFWIVGFAAHRVVGHWHDSGTRR
jgi:NitT/TauT family transport system permease protein